MSVAPSVVEDWVQDLGDRAPLLLSPAGRRALTRYDFRSFVFTYFRDLLKSPDTGDQVTLSEFHEAFIEQADRYVSHPTRPAESRTAWACPRGAGKSTWVRMLIVWLAAHDHKKFVALFSASARQAEDMLANIRGYFDKSMLLRQDYPELVQAALRPGSKYKVADNAMTIVQSNGFVCVGRGIGTAVLGLNINNTRPDFVCLDDLESDEEIAAASEAESRLSTIRDSIFPLNINAHVLWIGTTTRPGGLMEDLVHAHLGMEHGGWVEAENFRVNYWPALIDGRSMWPERWPLDWLQERQHDRSFLKSFQCLPAPEDYEYWQPDTFRYGLPPGPYKTILCVDPAVTTARTSDETGLAVLAYSMATQQVVVRHCEGVRLGPAELRTRVLQLLSRFPDVGLLYVETTQGGGTWHAVFHDVPARLVEFKPTVRKELRAQETLTHYERGRVLHEPGVNLRSLEAQMTVFPNGKHDDLVDAVGMGVNSFLAGQRRDQLQSAVS